MNCLLSMRRFQLHQRIATEIEELYRGYNFSLVIMSHPFVEIYFVNKGTNVMSFEMLLVKKLFYQNVVWTHFHTIITGIVTECIIEPHSNNFVDMLQSMSVCYDECCYSCWFTCLLKTRAKSRATGKAVTSKLSRHVVKKQKCDVGETFFMTLFPQLIFPLCFSIGK